MFQGFAGLQDLGFIGFERLGFLLVGAFCLGVYGDCRVATPRYVWYLVVSENGREGPYLGFL